MDASQRQQFIAQADLQRLGGLAVEAGWEGSTQAVEKRVDVLGRALKVSRPLIGYTKYY